MIDHPTLTARLRQPGFLSIPGVYDLVSARLAEAAGFDALYMTGYGMVASSLGLPDAGLATYSDMVERVRRLAETVSVPFIADGDTGYGGLLNVAHTVAGYERAGAAAIQIEDQEMPKKCGHTPGRQVIATADMVRKIRVATEARNSAEFLIVSRTDARTALGLDEALRRMDAYASAGADILFVEAPQSDEEVRLIGERFRGTTLLINQVEGGRTPILPAADLEALGFRIAIYPVAGLLSAAAAMDKTYAALKATGSTGNSEQPLYDFDRFSRLMGFERIWDFEKRWAAQSDGTTTPSDPTPIQ
jgi:2-methylisocitrate lyase-like PEP mutase family enzyme